MYGGKPIVLPSLGTLEGEQRNHRNPKLVFANIMLSCNFHTFSHFSIVCFLRVKIVSEFHCPGSPMPLLMYGDKFAVVGDQTI